MEKRKIEDKWDIKGVIWSVSCRIRGIGELIKHQQDETVWNEHPNSSYGIGTVLTGLADELDELEDSLDPVGTKEPESAVDERAEDSESPPKPKKKKKR